MLIRLMARYLRPYLGFVSLVIGLQLIQVSASLFLPNLNASIIDSGVAKGDTAFILRAGVLMLGVSLLQIIGQVGAAWFGARTAMSVGRDMRRDLFDTTMNFSTRELNKFGAPTLITRTTNDVQQDRKSVV